MQTNLKNLIRIHSAILFLIIVGCNEPPLYQTHARAFLEKEQIQEDVIVRLVQVKPLTLQEAEELSQFNNSAVLHLLASNPSISTPLIERLAQHTSNEVKTGVASNPAAPLDLVLTFRTPGKYTTLNEYIARNPSVPEELLLEMHKNGEASYTSFGLNLNCPRELMVKIAHEGSEIDRAWLATNRNLPVEIMLHLEHDKSKIVRNYLRSNPAYQRRLGKN